MQLKPIGIIHTCFKEKFGIPRQPGLIAHATGTIELEDHPFMEQALRGLEGFSHLWVIFVFHEHDAKNWKPQIRPPRLGGAQKMGVLASRSPHRPNPIGLSVVKIEKIDGTQIQVSGVDILDGSPVLDIKPYLPYADIVSEATSGWAVEPITRTSVQFSEAALEQIQTRSEKTQRPHLKSLIQEMLELDPRPAFQKRRMPANLPAAQGTRYGFALFEYDVKWEIRDQAFYVREVVDLSSLQVLKPKGK